MTPEEVCAKALVSRRLLTRIEAGKSDPGIDVVFRLARALDVKPAKLFAPRRRLLNLSLWGGRFRRCSMVCRNLRRCA